MAHHIRCGVNIVYRKQSEFCNWIENICFIICILFTKTRMEVCSLFSDDAWFLDRKIDVFIDLCLDSNCWDSFDIYWRACQAYTQNVLNFILNDKNSQIWYSPITQKIYYVLFPGIILTTPLPRRPICFCYRKNYKPKLISNDMPLLAV